MKWNRERTIFLGRSISPSLERKDTITLNVNVTYFTMFNTEIDFRAAIGSNTRGKIQINDVLGTTHFIGFQYSVFILYILHFQHCR